MFRWLGSAVTPFPLSTSAPRGQCFFVIRAHALAPTVMLVVSYIYNTHGCFYQFNQTFTAHILFLSFRTYIPDSVFVFFFFFRIVCDMAEALLPHSPGGPVELCIGVCSAEYRTLSTQTYSFVVSLCRSEAAAEEQRGPGFERSAVSTGISQNMGSIKLNLLFGV